MKSYYFKFVLILIASAGLTFTSCKKSTSAVDDSISAKDVNSVSNVVGSTSDDAAAAAGQVGSYKSLSLNWTNSNGNLLIDATITDTSSGGIVIQYAGLNACNGVLRKGTITVVGNGTPWHQANAELTVTYNNLSITDQTTGNTYTLNGSHTITNVTGGLAWQVAAGIAPTNLTPTNTVTHNITSSNMVITFPNGAQKTWSVSRQRTWNYNSGVLTVSYKSSLPSGVVETGTNRFGETFTNSVTNTIIANNSCTTSPFRPYTGTWEHQISNRTATVQFGTNALGSPVGTATYCGTYGLYGYYITYTNGSRTLNLFLSYWR